MLGSMIRMVFRNVLGAFGVRLRKDETFLPTYRGAPVALDQDPFRHLQIAAAQRYILRTGEPVQIDEDAVLDWRARSIRSSDV